MDWPPLEQCGALPAGGSWQLQERGLPGGRSEVLRQVEAVNIGLCLSNMLFPVTCSQ